MQDGDRCKHKSKISLAKSCFEMVSGMFVSCEPVQRVVKFCDILEQAVDTLALAAAPANEKAHSILKLSKVWQEELSLAKLASALPHQLHASIDDQAPLPECHCFVIVLQSIRRAMIYPIAIFSNF